MQLDRMLSTQKSFRKYGIKKPRRARKPDGKEEKQMLMGLALGLHVIRQAYEKVRFVAVQGRPELRMLTMIMAPFLALPLVVLAIPVVSLAIPAMILGGISANLNEMTKVKTVLDDAKFRSLDAKYGATARRNSLRRSQTSDAVSEKQRSSSSSSSSSSRGITGTLFRTSSTKESVDMRASRRIVSNTKLTARPRPALSMSGRRPVTRSRTFTFGADNSPSRGNL